MCGRYSITLSAADIASILNLAPPDFDLAPRYNLAPTQIAPVLLDDKGLRLVPARWGLIPPWAKDVSVGSKLINARSETLQEKVSFRQAFVSRRCVVPVDGFYEWRKRGNKKIPMRIVAAEGGLFFFAGLWELFSFDGAPPTYSFAIVTTEPNSFMSSIHHRMPAILHGNDARQSWLKASSPQALQALLRPYPGELLAYEVSAAVNSVKNDNVQCVQPANVAGIWHPFQEQV